MSEQATSSRWRRAIGELLVIVLGVLIALWAENWRESLQERALERTYLERLVGDLRRDTAAISEMMAITVERARHAQVVLSAISTGEIGVAPQEFVWAVEHASFWGYPYYSRSTFDDLMSTGNLFLIRDEQLKNAMSRYYSTIEGIVQFRDLYVPFQQELGRLLPDVLTLEQRYAVFDNLPDGYQSPFPWAQDLLEVDEADALQVLARLRRIEEMPTLYAAMARTQGRHHANQGRIRQAAIELLALAEGTS